MRKKGCYHKNRPFRLLVAAALRFVQSYLNDIDLTGCGSTALFFALLYNIRTICSYHRVLRHLHENALTAADLSRIQNALTFLSPLCRDTREAHEDMMGVPLKTDALLRAGR